jgi:hypothetical protein
LDHQAQLAVSTIAVCPTVSPIFEEAFRATEIRCKDRIGGGYGIRGRRDGSEIVIIQGANEEWFAFAYRLGNSASNQAPIDRKDLERLVENIEVALPQ